MQKEDKDLYIKKLESKIEELESELFKLKIRSANSPYDIEKAFPQKVGAIKEKIDLLKTQIEERLNAENGNTWKDFEEESERDLSTIITMVEDLSLNNKES